MASGAWVDCLPGEVLALRCSPLGAGRARAVCEGGGGDHEAASGADRSGVLSGDWDLGLSLDFDFFLLIG